MNKTLSNRSELDHPELAASLTLTKDPTWASTTRHRHSEKFKRHYCIEICSSSKNSPSVTRYRRSSNVAKLFHEAELYWSILEKQGQSGLHGPEGRLYVEPKQNKKVHDRRSHLLKHLDSDAFPTPIQGQMYNVSIATVTNHPLDAGTELTKQILWCFSSGRRLSMAWLHPLAKSALMAYQNPCEKQQSPDNKVMWQFHSDPHPTAWQVQYW